jgi:Tol biopolymer transport system component
MASGLFSPGETHVVLLADTALWLVPTGEPTKARKLADRSYAPNFSSDGKQVVYSTDSQDGSEVVLEQVDGTSSRVIANGERGLSATFVPGQSQLVLVQPGKVTLHSLEDSKEQVLLTYEGNPGARWLSPNGQKLLFDSDAGGEHTWHLLDLKGGAARQLDSLKGYQPYLGGEVARWLVFAESFAPGSGARFMSLDLESGDTREVLALDENQQYLGQLVTSLDGAYTLITSQAGDKQQLWLLRNKGGEPRMLAESSAVSGAISPDGRSVAVSSLEDKDGTYTASQSIVETEGNSTRPLASGYGPVWLRP